MANTTRDVYRITGEQEIINARCTAKACKTILICSTCQERGDRTATARAPHDNCGGLWMPSEQRFAISIGNPSASQDDIKMLIKSHAQLGHPIEVAYLRRERWIAH